MTTKNTPMVDGEPVTAKVALTYVAGEREILVGESVVQGRACGVSTKQKKAIVAMELAEAALFYFSAKGLSPLKAAQELGFVPYGPSTDGGRRPSVLPGKK